MPIYEYECAACGHRLEKLQKISDPPLTDCPACKEASLRKLVSPVAFRLKGGGWYETDFKDEKSRRNLAGEDRKTGESAGAGSTGAKDGNKNNRTPTDGVAAGKETKTAARPSGESAATSSRAG